MAQRLKRWESPRRKGRNSKGKGGSARQRQKKKQYRMLQRKLKKASSDASRQPKDTQERGTQSSLFLFA